MYIEEEHNIRITLAACHRLVAHFGWDDLIFSHLSARIPGTEDFLLTPYGYLFSDVTASSLIKISTKKSATDKNSNISSQLIHSGIYSKRPDVFSVIHTHTDYGSAVSAQACGLLPISQPSTLLLPTLSYHDYTGPVLTLQETRRLVKSLGKSNVLILRNHGLLTVGDSVKSAFLYMYLLEKSCKIQILAQASAVSLVKFNTEISSTDSIISLFLSKEILDNMWDGLISNIDQGFSK